MIVVSVVLASVSWVAEEIVDSWSRRSASRDFPIGEDIGGATNTDASAVAVAAHVAAIAAAVTAAAAEATSAASGVAAGAVLRRERSGFVEKEEIGWRLV